jgi:hypothetical protein
MQRMRLLRKMLMLAAASVPVCLQLIALRAMHRIPWYKPTIGTPDLRTYKAPETTVIYLINLAQFVILGVVFNKGYPHRWAAATLVLHCYTSAACACYFCADVVPWPKTFACSSAADYHTVCCFVALCVWPDSARCCCCLYACCRQPLWTNVGMLVAMILQVAFLIYSLFSVDAFTTKVQTMVGRGPPDGLPTAFRAGLLLIMVVHAAVSVLAELGSTYGLRLLDKTKSSGWLQRRRSTTDPVLRQGLLHPVHIGVPLPKHSPANGLHVPSLQPPSGAALL